MELTQDRVNELFDYQDGVLIRKVTLCGRAVKGKAVGTLHHSGYLYVRVDGKHMAVHRLVYLMHTGELKNDLDHIDTNRSNNRIENLRPATDTVNAYNRSLAKNNTSGIKGVSYHKANKKWTAQINVDGKRIYLGIYETIEEAKKVIEEARIKYHGEFANHG